MFPIPISGPALWLRDIRSRRRIWMTSVAGKLTRMAASIGIGGVTPFMWALCLVVLLSVLCSSVMSYIMWTRLDGRRWIGWTRQEVLMNGKTRNVMIPLFMDASDLRKVREGQ